MKTIILPFALLIFSACAAPQPGGNGGGSLKQPSQQPATQQFLEEVMEVVTDPPGARILLNGSGAGYAPVTVKVRRMWRGEAASPVMLDTVRLEAIPVEEGQCAQIRIFGAGSDRTPPQVSFDMHLCGGAGSLTQPAKPGSR